MKGFAINGLVIIVSLILALLAAEFAANMLSARPGPKQTLFFSPGSFVADEGDAVHYRPNSRLHTKSVFGETVEYDLILSVNNLGYIDTEQYVRIPANQAIAVVGDSFTAGFHGGDPWVPKLRAMPQLDGRAVYNLGVEGAGTKAFLNHLRLAARHLDFDTVLMIGITADFWRPVWRPVERGDRLWFCPTGRTDAECLASDTELRVLGGTPVAAGRDETASSAAPIKVRIKRVLGNIFPTLSRHLDDMLFARSMTAMVQEEAAATFDELQQWGRGKRLVFLQAPVRQEVIRGSFLVPLHDAAEARQITYVSGLECGLTGADYLGLDGHPNASGYDKIRVCAAAALGRVLH